MKQLLGIISLQLTILLATCPVLGQEISNESEDSHLSCTNVETCLPFFSQPLRLELRMSAPCSQAAEVAAPVTMEEETGPKNWHLVLFGLGIAPLEFLVSTALHEGAHAIFVEAAGGTVTAYRPYPHILDNGTFVFGSVSWTDIHNVSPAEEALISAAPMILDTAVLSTYSALSAFDMLPENKFARMSVIVFATGHWVDMLNHIISRNDQTDSANIRSYLESEHGLSELESNLATRIPQGVVLAASGAFIARDLVEIFRDTNYGRRPARTQLQESSLPGVYNLGVTPVVSSEFTGISFSGSF